MAAQTLKIKPPIFSGTAQENAWFWLEKFEAFCRNANIVDDCARVENFMLLLRGSAETWYMLLANDQKTTFLRLRAAFLHRFDNPQSNFCDADALYSRKQQIGEPVAQYIEQMMTLGAKLHIDVNDMVSTIKRGLLDPLRMHVMTCGVALPEELIQQATLAENYYIRSPYNAQCQPRTQHVHFDIGSPSNAQIATIASRTHADESQQSNADLKDMINQLAQQVEKLNVNAISSQQTRSRSPTPFRTYNTAHSQQDDTGRRENSQTRYFINSTSNAPFCTFCNSQGHNYDYCRLRQQINRQQQQQQAFQPPRNQNNFQHNRGRPMQRQYFGPPRPYTTSYTGERSNYNQPVRREFYQRREGDTRRYYNNTNYNQRLN